jgi:hypothetical protein
MAHSRAPIYVALKRLHRHSLPHEACGGALVYPPPPPAALLFDSGGCSAGAQTERVTVIERAWGGEGGDVLFHLRSPHQSNPAPFLAG